MSAVETKTVEKPTPQTDEEVKAVADEVVDDDTAVAKKKKNKKKNKNKAKGKRTVTT